MLHHIDAKKMRLYMLQIQSFKSANQLVDYWRPDKTCGAFPGLAVEAKNHAGFGLVGNRFLSLSDLAKI